MVDQLTGRIASVLVDDGEGGTVDDILNTQFFANGLDEGGLASPHIAMEGKKRPVVHLADKRMCRLADGF